MFNFKLTYTFLFVIIICKTTQQQQQREQRQNGIPPIACPNYFQYFHDGSKYFGKISLPNLGDNIDLAVNFTQRTLVIMNEYGQISLESKQPLQYRVDFLTPNEVPKLTKLTVNGQDICLSNNYPPPAINFFLNYRTTTQIVPSNQPQTSFRPQIFNQHLQPTQPVADDVTSFIPFGGNSQSLPEVAQPFPEGVQRFLKVTQPVQQVIQTPKKDQVVSDRPIESIAAATFSKPVPQNGQCGKETSIAGFVVGGEELSRGQFPWLTAVYQKIQADLKFLCGGSLVSPRTVVTAGHCVKRSNLSANRLLVHLGRHNLEDFSDESYVVRNIQNLIVHPDYNPNLFPDADLAILQLHKSVEYTRYIRPICLWTDSSDINRLVGQTGVVAGWGADETGRPTTALPKKVNTHIVSDIECRNSSATYNSLISGRTFCAGNRDGTGPCIGDSGSALMIYRNDRWILRGVVSAGQMKQHTCDVYEFVIFTDVAKHLQWLQSQVVS